MKLVWMSHKCKEQQQLVQFEALQLVTETPKPNVANNCILLFTKLQCHIQL